jgi:hypothetical protein
MRMTEARTKPGRVSLKCCDVHACRRLGRRRVPHLLNEVAAEPAGDFSCCAFCANRSPDRFIGFVRCTATFQGRSTMTIDTEPDPGRGDRIEKQFLRKGGPETLQQRLGVGRPVGSKLLERMSWLMSPATLSREVGCPRPPRQPHGHHWRSSAGCWLLSSRRYAASKFSMRMFRRILRRAWYWPTIQPASAMRAPENTATSAPTWKPARRRDRVNQGVAPCSVPRRTCFSRGSDDRWAPDGSCP